MGFINKLAELKEWKRGVSHCTFDPHGPGLVRIHLIPPRFKLFGNDAYTVILNGYYILPIGSAWAIILSAFMREVNRFDNKIISDEDEKKLYKNTVKYVSRAYPFTDKRQIADDLDEILDILFDVARGNTDHPELERLSIRQYAKAMTAPHRMDLAISSMTDEKGCWNCNQKCLFCYAAGQRMASVKELDTEGWKRVIDALKKAHVPMVTFTGGEPTVRQDLSELVEYAKEFVTRVNTNGTLLKDELVKRLIDAGLDSIQITLYSHDANIHNTLVGAEKFDDTVRGIKTAVKHGLDVSINTPLCSLNCEYEKTLEFIRSLGVRYCTVSGLICTGSAAENHGAYDLSPEKLYEILSKAKKYCNENSMEIDFTSPGLIPAEKLEALSMNVPSCGAALSNMAIAPDGTVLPCQSWLGADAGLGNILEVPFSKIWNNKKCIELRNMSDETALICPFRAERSKNG